LTDSPAVLFLTKLLPGFVLPLGLGLLLLALGAVAERTRFRRSGTAAKCAAFGLLWITSTPAFADWAYASLEGQYPPQTIAGTPRADVAILLGGAVAQPTSPRVAADLVASSDRVLHAARLWRAGKVERILVTGGNLRWLPAVKPEAELIRDLLVEWGVPADVIDFAGESRNTFENAREIVALRDKAGFRSALLVTSAAHMPRALAVFRKAGLPVTPATTDVEVVSGGEWTIQRWLPDAGALAVTSSAAREWIGFWAYRARGYL
jgi:uncharacterized SAM-binding protein YcdF (DUF218 family)